jgi:hypothetical protein
MYAAVFFTQLFNSWFVCLKQITLILFFETVFVFCFLVAAFSKLPYFSEKNYLIKRNFGMVNDYQLVLDVNTNKTIITVPANISVSVPCQTWHHCEWFAIPFPG